MEPNLIQLPSLVMEKIVCFLDVPSLKRLRLTCTLTKSVVDSPLVIKRIPVLIDTPRRINGFINRGSGIWSNFRFKMDDEWLPNTFNLLSRWGDLYGATTKVLSIMDMSGPEDDWQFSTVLPTLMFPAVVPLLLTCVNLESLEIEEIDLTQMSSMNWSAILKNWSTLRHIHIHHITCVTEASREKVADIVESVQGLISMTLPRIKVNKTQIITTFSPRIPDPESNTPRVSAIREYERLLLIPLASKIRDELRMKNKTSLRTLVCPEELLSTNSFIELAQLCNRASITLYHFQPAVMTSHILRVSNDLMPISNCLGSISGISEDILSQPLTNLRTLEINRSNFLFMLDGPYQVPALPNLETLRLNMSTWRTGRDRDRESAERLSEFLSCIQGRKRPNVKSVYISGFPVDVKNWANAHTLAIIRRPYLLYAFENLTCLELDSVQYVAREYLALWTNLKKLHEIIIRNCLDFDDSAIVGQQGAKVDPTKLILSLTDLNYITMQNTGQVTAISYVKAFSQMRLVRLHHEPKRRYELEDAAFASLIKGRTWEHLNFLKFANIGFSNYQEKKKFRRRFDDADCWLVRQPGELDTSSEESDSIDERYVLPTKAKQHQKSNCFCV